MNFLYTSIKLAYMNMKNADINLDCVTPIAPIFLKKTLPIIE